MKNTFLEDIQLFIKKWGIYIGIIADILGILGLIFGQIIVWYVLFPFGIIIILLRLWGIWHQGPRVKQAILSGQPIPDAKIYTDRQRNCAKWSFIFLPILTLGTLAWMICKAVQPQPQISTPTPESTATTKPTPTFTIPPNLASTLTPSPTPTDNISIEPTEINKPSSANVCSFSNGPLTVGMIDLGPNYLYVDIFTRLQDIGLMPTWISPIATYQELSIYDVVYLPSGWAIREPELERYPNIFKSYVNKGGGLLVEQANSDTRLSPSFLPFPITYLHDEWDREDWPLVVIDSSHILTRGIDPVDLPSPMDCAEMDDSYFTMVSGGKTRCTSLAITSYGDGRILLSMGNASPSMENRGYPMISDEVLCRMFGWLAKEYDH